MLRSCRNRFTANMSCQKDKCGNCFNVYIYIFFYYIWIWSFHWMKWPPLNCCKKCHPVLPLFLTWHEPSMSHWWTQYMVHLRLLGSFWARAVNERTVLIPEPGHWKLLRTNNSINNCQKCSFNQNRSPTQVLHTGLKPGMKPAQGEKHAPVMGMQIWRRGGKKGEDCVSLSGKRSKLRNSG